MTLFSRPARALALPAVLALTLAGCGASDEDGTSGTAAAGEDGDKLQVLASFYPLQYVTERIAGEHAEVVSLTAPGVDPHELELTPRQVGSLGSADLVVVQTGLQPAVDDAVAQQAGDHTLDVTAVAGLMTIEEQEEHADEAAHTEDDEHADEAAHTEDEEGHEGHGHAGVDPHFWLDPERYGHVAEAVATRLAEVDPDHATDYESNAQALVGDLEALDTELTEGLATCATRDVVTSHEAFGYLTDRYDLHQIGITGLSPEAEPSPARLAEISAQVEELGATTIYAEPLMGAAIADTVAAETGTTVLTLDPVEGISDASAADDYLGLMRANLTALREGLGCS